MMRDVAVGIHACLQIFTASELERAANADAENLRRLVIAASGLLRQAAEARIRPLNDSV
jgi:hypothetical protein